MLRVDILVLRVDRWLPWGLFFPARSVQSCGRYIAKVHFPNESDGSQVFVRRQRLISSVHFISVHISVIIEMDDLLWI